MLIIKCLTETYNHNLVFRELLYKIKTNLSISNSTMRVLSRFINLNMYLSLNTTASEWTHVLPQHFLFNTGIKVLCKIIQNNRLYKEGLQTSK